MTLYACALSPVFPERGSYEPHHAKIGLTPYAAKVAPDQQ